MDLVAVFLDQLSECCSLMTMRLEIAFLGEC